MDACGPPANCVCAYRPTPKTPVDGVLEVVVTGIYTGRVTATYGNVGPNQIGDTLCVVATDVGATVLVPVPLTPAGLLIGPADAGICANYASLTITLDDAGRPQNCAYPSSGAGLPVTQDQMIAALQANDCVALLASIDPRWAEDPCPPAGGCSCHMGPAEPSQATLSMLVAVAAVLAARKLARRR